MCQHCSYTKIFCLFVFFTFVQDFEHQSFFCSPLFPSVAPPGINVLEHESIALDMPSSYSTFHPPNVYASKSGPPPAVKTAAPPTPKEEPFKPSFTPIVQPRELPRQRLPESFNLVTPLPTAFSLRTDCPVSLYRARMENRNVVLRVLKGRGRRGEKWWNKSIKQRQWESLRSHRGSDLSSYRLRRCHREAQLLGLRLLPITAGAASLPAGAPWRGLTSGSPGYSAGGAGEPRPAQPPLEMQRGKSNWKKNNKKTIFR